MTTKSDNSSCADVSGDPPQDISRRTVLRVGAALGATVVGTRVVTAQEMPDMPGMDHGGHTPTPTQTPTQTPISRSRAPRYQPVIVPNGKTLPFKVVDGVKVFHLIAESVAHTFTPGLAVTAWGYNGGTPGPLIEAIEGDRVRIYVTNKLPESTTVHWHGLFLPSGMDGVAGLSQKPIEPGQTFKYEFTLTKPGTFMYHPHFDEMVQIALGMVGMIVVHPKVTPSSSHPIRDYSLMLHEWKVPIGAARPDPMAMNDFNVLTLNSKCYPSTEPLVAEVGDLVRIRIGNLGPMDSHPIHLHGYAFEVVYTDGGPVPKSARWPETTVIVPVGACRVIEFVANAPGDWALHCHMTHHVMNQMGHDVDNLIGADTTGLGKSIGKHVRGYMPMGETGMGDMMEMPMPANSISMMGSPGPFSKIDMGGMFTIVKVRDSLRGDPGWFANPKGTVADVASVAELARDGITTH
jgi:manganese oxidase